MGIRAASFSDRLGDEFEMHTEYRTANKIGSIGRFFWRLCRLRPSLCYVFDMGFSGVLAGVFYRGLSGCPLVVDTGDAIHELALTLGNRGRLGLFLTRMLEWTGVSMSDLLIVRGHPHQELFEKQGRHAEVIPDGVDTNQFYPRDASDLRRRWGVEGSKVIGLLGSLTWNPRLNMSYGWELIELIDQLRDWPVKGLIIGDGSGLEKLKAQCAARGIADRMVFCGRIPYDQLPEYLNMMDIALSTQTNDIVGQVRTTGKLPLYLATGCYVLASEVGEAARVLPAKMLVPYEGTLDGQYTTRLLERVRDLLQHPLLLQQSQTSVAIAREHFDYQVLAAKLRDKLRGLVRSDWDSREELPGPAIPERAREAGSMQCEGKACSKSQ
jgi:glycosyltransferase involved in cell wall biosynthesis